MHMQWYRHIWHERTVLFHMIVFQAHSFSPPPLPHLHDPSPHSLTPSSCCILRNAQLERENAFGASYFDPMVVEKTYTHSFKHFIGKPLGLEFMNVPIWFCMGRSTRRTFEMHFCVLFQFDTCISIKLKLEILNLLCNLLCLYMGVF